MELVRSWPADRAIARGSSREIEIISFRRGGWEDIVPSEAARDRIAPSRWAIEASGGRSVIALVAPYIIGSVNAPSKYGSERCKF